MKVLIAEDERMTRTKLRATLKRWGHDVVVCETGLGAWAVLQEKEPPKLAILDWMMPGMEGVELCQKVRTTPGIQSTYLILLTGRDSKEDIVQGLEAGADDYVVKPFDQEALRVRVHVGERIVALQEQALAAEQARVVMQTAGGVAHEINQPLTVILGMAEMWTNLLDENDPMWKDVIYVREAAQRISSIVKKMQEVKDYMTTDYVGGTQIVDFGMRESRSVPEREG